MRVAILIGILSLAYIATATYPPPKPSKPYCICSCSGQSTRLPPFIDPCAYAPCQNGGTCFSDRSNPETFGCECPELIVGEFCEFAGCVDILCGNGGTCVPEEGNTFRCECTPPFVGELCEQDPCDGVVCRNGALCVTIGFDHICDCPNGYEGVFCESAVVLTSCEDVDCNRGECQEEGGVARCACPPFATGVFCENDLCLSVNCDDGRATCEVIDPLPNELPFKCNCVDQGEFTNVGIFCLREACAGFGEAPCNMNGRCLDAEREVFSRIPRVIPCDCNEGFFGNWCQLGPCSNDRCQNGGSCQYVNGEFTSCICKDGYGGDSCEIETCFGNSCENGGRCIVNGGTFRCNCPRGFSGELCEIDFTTCFGVKCLNLGTCVGTSEEDASCDCAFQFFGDRCQFDSNPQRTCTFGQSSGFCLNNGLCLVDNFVLLGCDCKEGFSGAMCEVGPCPEYVVCRDPGVCVIVNGVFNHCRCPEGAVCEEYEK